MSLGSIDVGWLDKPWMYSKPKPKNPELLKKWRETWTDYLLKFAQQKSIHLINTIDLKREDPFSRLDQEAFQDIVYTLTEQGYGKWWNEKKNLLRIYWRTLDQWASNILELARKKEKSVINGPEGLVELEPQMVTMPTKEIEQVLAIMVERGFARWVDKKNRAIKVIY